MKTLKCDCRRESCPICFIKRQLYIRSLAKNKYSRATFAWHIKAVIKEIRDYVTDQEALADLDNEPEFYEDWYRGEMDATGGVPW